jgi:tRNA G18 (ribose-2'-O)-methylase SpoU
VVNSQYITDVLDPRLDDYRSLRDVVRRRAGTFIAESEAVIRQLLATSHAVRSLLLTPSRFERLADCLADVDAPVFITEAANIDAVVGFPLHRGALALGIRPPIVPPSDVLRSVLESVGEVATVVVLEDVVDPDNLGSVFRHAAGFGADAVLLSPHAGDPLYRKAIRTSMGWSLSIPCGRWSVAPGVWVDELRSFGFTTVALTPGGDTELWDSVGSPRTAFLLGAESVGLTAEAMAAADIRARIPMANGVDSLNVAATGALALYERLRRDRNQD